MSYGELLEQYKNVENLGYKAWEHSIMLDNIAKITEIKYCAIHCFHYQQMFEMLFKHILETKSRNCAFPFTHKLEVLLEKIISATDFKCDFDKYYGAFGVITVCAEAYRYNFNINCKLYRRDVKICDELLKELIGFNFQLESSEEI